MRQDWNSNTTKTQCTFSDLKKAFDTVDHILLLEKCDAYGFWGPVFDLLKPYLKNRQQYVATKTKQSQNKKCELCGTTGFHTKPASFHHLYK